MGTQAMTRKERALTLRRQVEANHSSSWHDFVELIDILVSEEPEPEMKSGPVDMSQTTGSSTPVTGVADGTKQ